MKRRRESVSRGRGEGERGRLRERAGDYAAALPDLETYVRYRPDARDAQTVKEAARSLRRHMNAETS